MAENNNSGTSVGQPSEPSSSTAILHLLEFWIDTPSGWFFYVESKFPVRNITLEHVKFDLKFLAFHNLASGRLLAARVV
jgi:hypothetical protein